MLEFFAGLEQGLKGIFLFVVIRKVICSPSKTQESINVDVWLF